MSTKKIYLDTCCFVELALGPKSKRLHDGGKYLWELGTALRAGRDKRLIVVTSLFTVAECVHADGDVSEETQSVFRSILTSGAGGVTLWQTDIFVFENARDLKWKHNIKLRPADSIHVASAIDAQCDEFWTWDEKILKAKQAIGNLGVSVVVPSDSKHIPQDYKQAQFLLVEQASGTATPATPRR